MLTKLTLTAFIFICVCTCLSAMLLLVVCFDGSLHADDSQMTYLVWVNSQVIAMGVFIASVLGTVLLKRKA
jgi:hypothetical protein